MISGLVELDQGRLHSDPTFKNQEIFTLKSGHLASCEKSEDATNPDVYSHKATACWGLPGAAPGAGIPPFRRVPTPPVALLFVTVPARALSHMNIERLYSM